MQHRRNIRSFREPDRGIRGKDELGLVENPRSVPMGWPENWHAARLWVDIMILTRFGLTID